MNKYKELAEKIAEYMNRADDNEYKCDLAKSLWRGDVEWIVEEMEEAVENWTDYSRKLIDEVRKMWEDDYGFTN